MQLRYFIFLLIFSTSLFSQQKKWETLQVQIAQEKDWGKKAILTADLAADFRFIDIKKSYQLANEAIEMSENSKNMESQIKTHIFCTKVFKKADSISQMINSGNEALKLSQKLNNKILLGLSWHNKGFVEMNLYESDLAMQYFFKSLELLESSKEYVTISKNYYYIYGLYAEKGELDKEIKYANSCIEFAEKSMDPETLCLAYQAIGTVFSDQYEKTSKPEMWQKSVKAFEKSLAIFNENSEQIVSQNQFGIVSLNLANLYISQERPLQKDKILFYTKSAIENAKKNNDIIIQVNALQILSDLAKKEKNDSKAEKHLLQAKDLVEKNTFKDEYLNSSVYYSLANFYEEKKKPNEALFFYKKYIDYFSKLNDHRKKSNIRILEAKFQTQKKEEQLQLLTQKNRLQESLIYLYLAMAILAILGSVFLYRSNKFKLKFEKQKSIVLETQKEEAELLTKLKEEENARIEAENRLIVTQKEQMQKQLLAGALQIEHKNELLQSLKEKFNQEKFTDKAQLKLHQILQSEMQIDNNLDQVKNDLQDINPEFFKKLNEKSGQKLTTLDLKYCAAIHSNLNTKQIAMLFSVEPESVRMSKYRIKQKLNLGKNDDLEDYLKTIR
ncbi:hypothetical protein IW15_18030 [Chryseobacterium soli]|uniref:HTH luxR-type domain-containing protein n=1 Tax=Chryseobacterium soli TaxID=445961 RepID=A0A086A2Z3_9FLAO|nr:hypothetical protein [Chryseobacterium soli]KFF11057.1 hypothetical protein IW15_18030 [Chryseobacterium soli]